GSVLRGSWLRTSASSGASIRFFASFFDGTAYDNRAIARDEIFLRDCLRLRGGDGEEAVKHRVDALRIAIEKREKCEIVPEAEARHVGTHAAFEHRVVIGAEFNFHGVELFSADSLLLNVFNNGIESGDGCVAGVFGAMKDARDHLGGAIGIEGVVAAVGFERDLFFEDQLAIDAPRTAAVQHAFENCGGVPIVRGARRRGVSDGEGGKRTKLFRNGPATFFRLRRLGDVGAWWRRLNG